MCLYTSTFLLIPLILTIYSYFWLIAVSESLSLDALRSLKMRSMIAVILPVCLLIVAVVWIFKSRLSAEQKKNRVGILDRCKKNITVGAQGIVITTVVGRLYAFCVVDNAFNVIGFPLVLLTTIVSLYFIFIFNSDLKCKADEHSSHQKKHSISMFFQIIGSHGVLITFIITMMGGVHLFVVFWQVLLTFVFATSYVDIQTIEVGRLKLKKRYEEPTMSAVVAVPMVRRTEEGGSDNSNSRPDCKICMREYNESIIPRMLSQCGHTICEECVGNMLKTRNNQFVSCPFCQRATLVNGPANLLPKNFALLEVMDSSV